jgi:hypothetical protein
LGSQYEEKVLPESYQKWYYDQVMYDVELLSPAVEFLGSLEAKLRPKATRTIELLR